MRRAARVDRNQADIVNGLRAIPGVSVEVGHDDILVGYQARTYWYEIKAPEAVSRRNETILGSQLTHSERRRLDDWEGHYRVVWDINHILDDLGIIT